MMELWPFTNFHDLNLDWIIRKIRNVEDSEAAAKASEEAAAGSADHASAAMGMALVYQNKAKNYRDEAQGFANDAQDSADSIAGVVDQVNTNTGRIDNLIANAGDGTIPSELVDIRVGYNGDTYNTAGTAVRSQVEDLHKDLKNATSYELPAMTSGYLIRTSTDPVNTTPEANANFVCALVDCEEGDTFIITSTGGSVAHSCVFIESDGTVVKDVVRQANHVEELEVVAPANSEKLVFNADAAQEYKLVKNYPLTADYPLLSSDYEEGGINGSTGENAQSNRMRSKTYVDDHFYSLYTDDDHKFCVYIYEDDGTYVGVWSGTVINTGSPRWLTQFEKSALYGYTDYKTYKYRIVFENPIIPENVMYSLLFSNTKEYSTYINERINDIKLPEIPNTSIYGYTSDEYAISDDDVSVTGTSAGVYSMYDTLMANHSDIITKTTLTEGVFTNYEYVIDTGNYNTEGNRSRDTAIVKPTILITSGVHGDEKSSVMSAYAFIKDMCEGKHPASTVLNKCKIRIIPVVTPWAYDNDTRWNENGVNINRNFDADWTLNGQPFAYDYSGPSAASENETKIVQNWINTYKTNASLLIDFHNSGYTNEVSYLAINSTDNRAQQMKKTYLSKISDITGYWYAIRNMSNQLINGYTGSPSNGATCEHYGRKQGVISALLETSWNQNSTGLHSDQTIGIGAEAFSCVMLSATKVFTPLS